MSMKCEKPVKPVSADLSAGDYSSIQEALDALPPEGGRVYIPPGTYILEGSLKPRDNVTISGSGPSTILKACDLVKTETVSAIGVGEKIVKVKNSLGLKPGMDVFIHKNVEWGDYVRHTFSYTITSVDENTLKLDKPAAVAQPEGSVLCTGTPPILLLNNRNVVVENLTVDGNRKPDWVYVNLKMAGIYLLGTSDCIVRNCFIINASGDGISAQFPPPPKGAGNNNGKDRSLPENHNGTMILDNHIKNSSCFGIHIGVSQAKSIIRGNIVTGSGWDGFYWCWNNFLTVVTDNIFTHNTWNGIGGLGDGGTPVSDIYNINSNNICAYNGYSGIHVTGGRGNIVSGNVVFANSTSGKGLYPGIKVSIPYPEEDSPNKTYFLDTLLTGNVCSDKADAANQKKGIEIDANVKGVVQDNNVSEGNIEDSS